MTKINKDWLQCPFSREELTDVQGGLKSSVALYKYNKENDYWNFISENHSEFKNKEWETWQILQNNGVVSYESNPTSNLGVGKRKDFLQFADFCRFRGFILDIGVGPQKVPTHIEYNENSQVKFIGVDPLVGEQPREFPFIQALGEHLPFKDKMFDQVLFVTTLDHFIDPKIVLVEAKRVLKNNGEILIWLGEKDKDTPKPEVSPEWYENLEVPDGAEDPFHFKRFSIDEFKGYLSEVNLKITDQRVIAVDKWRKNCFYRVSKC